MSPLFAIGLLVSILFCGLTLDIGRMEVMKVQMQNASDAAAIGAELASENGLSGTSNWTTATNWVSQGQADAAVNGFTNGQNNTTVSVQQNPAAGPYAGRYDAIQVTITKTFNTIFMGGLNGGKWTLSTQSIALVPGCAYFLGGASGQYTTNLGVASAGFIATCPAYFNLGLQVDGFSKAWAFGLDVSGPSSSSNGSGWTSQQTQSGYGGNPPGQYPTFGVPVIADPLLTYIPTQPTFNGACNMVSYAISAGVATLNPGTYCGTKTTPGMSIQNATVTLNPGLYTITGGATWNRSTITGTGVTLFFTQGNGAGFGQLLAGSGGTSSNLTLSAPTTTAAGGIPGILFFADRNWVATAAQDFKFDTYGSFTGDGIWYLPNTGLYIWLNTFNMPNYGSFVTRNAYVFGTEVHAGQNFSWLSGGSPFRTQSVLVQ